jgi:uncharacterized membrane protein
VTDTGWLVQAIVILSFVGVLLIGARVVWSIVRKR